MENVIDYIEKYFNGDLTNDERENFERKRSEDQEFDRIVRTYQKAEHIIRENARLRMKARLDKIGKEQSASNVVDMRDRFISKYWLSVAASVIFISAIAYFALNRTMDRNGANTLAALYDNNFIKPGIDLVITRGSESDSMERIWNSALELYNKSEYRTAADRLDYLLKSPSFTMISAANFFAGICYMQMNENDSAGMRLSGVSASSAFYDESQWYLALNSIRSGDTSAAADILQIIKDNKNHPKQKEASRLLRQLRKL